MSVTLDRNDRPRRGRPPSRNEMLRANRLAGLSPRDLVDRFGSPLYVYDLDVIDRQVADSGRRSPNASSWPTPSRPIRPWRSSRTSAALDSAPT